MTLPQQIGVYGGGRMGAGIAHAFLVSGASVTVVEASTADFFSPEWVAHMARLTPEQRLEEFSRKRS